MAACGPEARRFAVSAPVFVVTGDTDEPRSAAASVATRKQIAFYGSTPAYRGCWNSTAGVTWRPNCTGCPWQGEWDTMGTLIDDDVLDAFAVVAPLPELAGALRQRCDGVIDRVMASFPAGTPEPVVARILDELRGERRVDTTGSASAGAIGASVTRRCSECVM